jgi:hypothetical protein
VRRITILALAFLGVVAAAQPAEAALRVRAHAPCPTCGILNAHASRGWIGQTAGGATEGYTLAHVDSGTIWVRDNSHRGDYTLGLNGHRRWSASRRAWRVTGSNLNVTAWGGRWWVRVSGSGISVTSGARETVYLEGHGGYSAYTRGQWLSARRWPSAEVRRLLIKE